MWRMERKAISGWEETQESDCYIPSITLSEEPKFSSPEHPQQSSNILSVQARAAGGGGEGNSHS